MEQYWFLQARRIVLKVNDARHEQGASLLHVGARDLFVSLMTCVGHTDVANKQTIERILLHALLDSKRFYPDVPWKEPISIIDWCAQALEMGLRLIPIALLIAIKPYDRHHAFGRLLQLFEHAWHVWDRACLGGQSPDHIQKCFQKIEFLAILIEILVYFHDVPCSESQFRNLLVIQGRRWPSDERHRLQKMKQRIGKLFLFQQYDAHSKPSSRSYCKAAQIRYAFAFKVSKVSGFN